VETGSTLLLTLQTLIAKLYALLRLIFIHVSWSSQELPAILAHSLQDAGGGTILNVSGMMPSRAQHDTRTEYIILAVIDGQGAASDSNTSGE
jgi:hypothetical protein